jgi:hypothetical protein
MTRTSLVCDQILFVMNGRASLEFRLRFTTPYARTWRAIMSPRRRSIVLHGNFTSRHLVKLTKRFVVGRA